MAGASSKPESIFFAALEKPTAEEQAAYLDRACGQDTDLRRRVEKLLAAQPNVGKFLEEPLTDLQDAGEPAGSQEGPGTVIGAYKLLQEIGEGGFGIVYMAEQLEPMRRHVALKIIKPGMDTREVIARFEAERQALAMMDHSNIARILDAGATKSGRPYFVMELVKGVPITEFCDKNNFDTAKRLKLFMTVCRAVQHAHQKGVIHRDIKPSNIMITLHDGDPVAKVIDFGVSKAISQRLTEKTLFTRYGQMVGTPQYMSPEQAEMSGLDVDTRSDVYSLGVLLYELLTGTTPLEGEKLRTAGYAEMVRMIQTEEPAKPSTRVSSLGDSQTVVCQYRSTDAKRLRQMFLGDLDWIVMKALAKHRDRRYETASELVRDIERHLDNEPVHAGPPSATYLLSKIVRRHKVAVFTVSCVLAALIIGLAAAIWGLSVANRQRNIVKAERDAAQNARELADDQRKVADEARRHADELREETTVRAKELERRVYLMHLVNANRFLLEEDYHRARVELGFCPKAPRRWEWSFLQQRIDAIVPLTVSGAENPIYTNDGRRLIAAGVPGSPHAHKARIWDTSSGELLGEFHHKSPLLNIALSADETLLAGGAKDGSLRLWDFQTKQELRTIPRFSEKRFGGLAINPKNNWIAAATWDGTLNVFEPTGGDRKFSRSFEATDPNLRKVMFSPDGRWISVGAPPSRVIVDANTGETVAEFPERAHEATFSPDGRRIAAGNKNEIVIWNWDGAQLTCERSWKQDTEGNFWDLVFSSDGAHLASVQGAHRVRVWDVATGDELGAIDGVQVYWSAMHPTKNQVAFCSSNGRIRFWDYLGNEKSITRIQVAKQAKFSPDGNLIALDTGAQVSIHDVASGELINTIDGEMGVEPWIDATRVLIVAGPDNSFEIRNAESGELEGTLPRKSNNDPWFFVRPDGLQFTAVGWHYVRTWDIAARQLNSHECRPESVGWLAPAVCGHRVALVLEHRIEIWDTKTATKTHTVPLPGRRFFIVEFSHDGKNLFVGSDGGMLTMHHLDSPKEPVHFTGHVRLRRLALSPDGTQLLASDWDHRAIVWDVKSRQPLITLTGEALDWSPDGQRIALGTPDGVELWRLPQHD